MLCIDLPGCVLAGQMQLRREDLGGIHVVLF